MTTVNYDTYEEPLECTYDDLDCGDVFLDQDGDLMMKVCDTVSTVGIKKYLLCLTTFELYDDVYDYEIHRLLDANIDLY